MANASMKVLNEGMNTATRSGKALWSLVDRETGEIALTKRGLLAVYTTRDQARAARERVRVAKPVLRRFGA